MGLKKCRTKLYRPAYKIMMRQMRELHKNVKDAAACSFSDNLSRSLRNPAAHTGANAKDQQ